MSPWTLFDRDPLDRPSSPGGATDVLRATEFLSPPPGLPESGEPPSSRGSRPRSSTQVVTHFEVMSCNGKQGHAAGSVHYMYSIYTCDAYFYQDFADIEISREKPINYLVHI